MQSTENRKQPEIKMNPVKSSNASHCGFCEETGRLAVTFKGGRTYHYQGVPKEDYDELMGADSFGKHLNMNIKGRFGFQAV